MSGPTHHTSTPFTASLEKLEFDRILERIAALVYAEPSRKRVARIVPHFSIAHVRSLLAEVTAAKRLLLEEDYPPFTTFRDVTVALKKSAVDRQVLLPNELLDVQQVLELSRGLNGYLKRKVHELPLFASYLDALYVDKVLEFNIDGAIERTGEIKDSASKELRQIRHGKMSAREQLQKRLSEILRRVSEEEFTQDDIITTRDGRFVIPIKTEFKQRVSGFIHSSSASGATVYVEPTETLELNNALRELEIAEQREIQRILGELTRQVGEHASAIQASYETLCELDVLFAKARYSIDVLGTEPRISETPMVLIRDGRHPVLLQRLGRKDVVPITLELGGEDGQTLVITGPNAGGKTVALKTVGILTFCAMAGLHVPASDDSVFYLFRSVFVDMGDDQSIEKDLSTFSSHLIRLRDILERADERSLVLVDEIGTGTDPVEGSALAEAVLTSLTERGTTTIATTHHGSLKAFAHSTNGVVNGSMEFDRDSLRPTYRFVAGIPGSSFALELAERFGLPVGVLDQARKTVGGKQQELETLLRDLERLRQSNSDRERELSRLLADAEERSSAYAEKLGALKDEANTIRKKALDDARQLLEESQRKVEAVIREIRESQADKERTRAARHDLSVLKEELDGSSQEMMAEPRAGELPLQVGDAVLVRSTDKAGEIVSIERGKATVLVGSIRAKVPLRELVRARGSKKPERRASAMEHHVDADASPEVDVRGMYLDEALAVVERALDKAHMQGLYRVDIIHGMGTGALRKGISEYLKNASYVRSFRTGEWGEGGTGITIVELLSE